MFVNYSWSPVNLSMLSYSMSKAGYLYDNAQMEQYFNTVKNKYANLYEFRAKEQL